jgi:hypothetical protein
MPTSAVAPLSFTRWKSGVAAGKSLPTETLSLAPLTAIVALEGAAGFEPPPPPEDEAPEPLPLPPLEPEPEPDAEPEPEAEPEPLGETPVADESESAAQ